MGKYTMLHNINKMLCVLLDDGRTITGKLLVFDKHMNVVLGDAVEEQPQKKKAIEEGRPAVQRQLGLILLRGEHVVSVTVQKDGANGGSAAAADFSRAPKSATAGAAKRAREE